MAKLEHLICPKVGGGTHLCPPFLSPRCPPSPTPLSCFGTNTFVVSIKSHRHNMLHILAHY